MTEAMHDEDELYDPYENDNGPKGAPVASWARIATGQPFTGILVPSDPIGAPEKGYDIRREWQNGTDADPEDKGYLVFPPKGNLLKMRRPVTEQKFLELFPDHELPVKKDPKTGLDGRVSRVEHTFQTEYYSREFMSDNAVARMEDNEVDPDGVLVRRVIQDGEDIRKKIEAALKKVGRKPLVGQRWTITILKRVPNENGRGATKNHSVEIEPPTSETLAIVAKYIRAAREEAGIDDTNPEGLNDPYKGVDGAAEAVPAQQASGEAEQPPF